MLIEGSSCQSRLVKNEMPYLLWTIKRDVVDYHSLSCEQMLNHYGKTASFTTKVDGRAWGFIRVGGLSRTGRTTGTVQLLSPPPNTHCLRSHTPTCTPVLCTLGTLSAMDAPSQGTWAKSNVGL